MVKVAELRKARGVSQYALAKALGITSQAVVAWEQGRSTPTTAMVIKLADFFECSTDEVLGRKKEVG